MTRSSENEFELVRVHVRTGPISPNNALFHYEKKCGWAEEDYNKLEFVGIYHKESFHFAVEF